MLQPVAVSIVIPTFRRPVRAVQAVSSALAQAFEGAFEVVAVDNDPEGSALAVLSELASGSQVPLRVIHAPQAGVASARNAGLAATQAPLIAFLDDDEIAPAHWLAELVRVQAATRADVVFGPVRTRLEAPPARHAAFFEAFFAREPGHAEGLIDEAYGCGCSLLRRAAIPCDPPFSLSRNQTGGEDDLLFRRIRDACGHFAWAPQAFVWETPEPGRVNLDYTLRRAFAFGQGPATQAFSRSPPDLPAAAGWMLVGAGQALTYGLASLCGILLRLERRAFLYRRCVEGLGKVFWFPFLRQKLYGAPARTGRTPVKAPGPACSS